MKSSALGSVWGPGGASEGTHRHPDRWPGYRSRIVNIPRAPCRVSLPLAACGRLGVGRGRDRIAELLLFQAVTGQARSGARHFVRKIEGQPFEHPQRDAPGMTTATLSGVLPACTSRGGRRPARHGPAVVVASGRDGDRRVTAAGAGHASRGATPHLPRLPSAVAARVRARGAVGVSASPSRRSDASPPRRRPAIRTVRPGRTRRW